VPGRWENQDDLWLRGGFPRAYLAENAAALARSMDVSVTAVNHYLELLAGTLIVRVLPPSFEWAACPQAAM